MNVIASANVWLRLLADIYMSISWRRAAAHRKTSHPSPLTLHREEDASTGAITAVATLLQLLHTQDQEAVHAASNTLKQLAGGAADAQPGSGRTHGHLSQLSCPIAAGFDDSRSLVAVRLQGLPTSTMLNGKDAPNWLAEGVNAFVDLILLGKRLLTTSRVSFLPMVEVMHSKRAAAEYVCPVHVPFCAG